MDMRVKRAAARRQGSADAAKPTDAAVKPVNLALQGGGAHGAFAWGVLDRLIEDGRLSFEGISATSAGAMNAAVLAYGWTQGGPDGARQALAGFWRAVSEAGALYSPYQPLPWGGLMGSYSLDQSPGYLLMDMATRLFSPYQLNPTNFNPLREVLERHVDFAALRRHSAIKLFLAATNVETCKVPSSSAATSRPTRCWPRPACPSCSRRCRSTASISGTAATSATRRSTRSSTSAIPAMS